MTEEAKQSIAEAAQAAADALELDANLSPEEQKKARKCAYTKEYNRLYREAHKDKLKEQHKQYYKANKTRLLQRANDYYREHTEHCKEVRRQYKRAKIGTNMSFETFSDSEPAPQYESAATYIIDTTDATDEAHKQFTELLKSKGMSDEEIETAYGLARLSMIYKSSQRGYRFESAVRAVMLKELADTPYKLYKQVSINGGTCKIDFVITKEVTDDKTTLHLENAIILSTKTATGTSWREDMHLYSKCKAYVMLTISTEYPMEQLPDNVYFVSPMLTADAEHKLTLAGLLSLVRSTLDA